MARPSLVAVLFVLASVSSVQAQDITADFLRQGLPIPLEIQQILSAGVPIRANFKLVIQMECINFVNYFLATVNTDLAGQLCLRAW